MTRVLTIVQNLPVPFDRRVGRERPKGNGDPADEVIKSVELYNRRPYAPGSSKLSFVADHVYPVLEGVTTVVHESGRDDITQRAYRGVYHDLIRAHQARS